MKPTRRQSFKLLALGLAIASLALPAAAHDDDDGYRAGRIFTSTNAPSGNEVWVFAAIVLTAAGRALVPLLAGLADANDEQFFGHLGQRQRQELMGTLQVLVQHHDLKSTPTA